MPGLAKRTRRTVKKYRKRITNKKYKKGGKSIRKGSKSIRKSKRRRYKKGGEPPFDAIATEIVKLMLKKKNMDRTRYRSIEEAIEAQIEIIVRESDEQAQSDEYQAAIEEKTRLEDEIKATNSQLIEPIKQQIQAKKVQLEQFLKEAHEAGGGPDIDAVMADLEAYADRTIDYKVAAREHNPSDQQQGIHEREKLLDMVDALKEYNIVIDERELNRVISTESLLDNYGIIYKKRPREDEEGGTDEDED